MKNKLSYVVILFLISFSFINIVIADDKHPFELSIDFANGTNVDVPIDSEISVKVKIKSDSAITDCTIKVENDTNLEFLGIDNSNLVGWSAIDDNGVDGIVTNNISNGKDFTSWVNVLELKYKVKGSGTLKLASSSYCMNDQDLEYLDVPEKTLNVTAKNLSELATLKTLTVDGKEVDNFYSNKYGRYDVFLEKKTFSIGYETTNPDYMNDVVIKVKGTDTILNKDNIVFNDPTGQGMMMVDVIVKNVNTYNMVLFYQNEDVQLDNSLKSLTINGQAINLVKGKIDGYSITVGSDVDRVSVVAELMDITNFKFSDNNSGSWEQSIQGSKTVIPIQIVPVNSDNGGQSVTYIVEVLRENENPSTSPSSKPSSSSSKPSSESNVGSNPGTGEISKFLMALVLISSLIGSVLLYYKNVEYYK